MPCTGLNGELIAWCVASVETPIRYPTPFRMLALGVTVVLRAAAPRAARQEVEGTTSRNRPAIADFVPLSPLARPYLPETSRHRSIGNDGGGSI
jgi:hypothetical protein